ncbi:MAG: biotin/lipoyl-containing protein [Rubricoccaceae bacterium]
MPVEVRAGSRTFRVDASGTVARVTEQEAPGQQAPGQQAPGQQAPEYPVRLTPLGGDAYLVVLGGRPRVATAERDARGRLVRVTLGSTPVPVDVRSRAEVIMARLGLDAGEDAAAREVRAPMPGLVLRVLAAPGDAVEAGQGLVVLEAMKMENELKAPAAGTVAAVHAAPGSAVAKNDLLVELA